MGKIPLWIVSFAVLILGVVMPVEARAVSGEIVVNLDFPDGEVREGAVKLYQVGTPEGDYFLLKASFGGGLVRKEEAQSAALARWLYECAEEEGVARILDADGTACYSGLEEGLYLLAQDGPIEGIQKLQPMLIPIPAQSQWDLVALPQYQAIITQVPKTGQHFSPVFGAMCMVLSGMAVFFLLDRCRRK